MAIRLEKIKEPLDIPEALVSIVGSDGYEAFRFFDECVYDEGKGYNTYKIVAGDKAYVLKKYGYPEDLEDEVKQYALLSGLPVPELLGVAEGCILMRFVEGDDLKNPSDDGVRALASSLCAVMNAYPMGSEYERARYEKYLRRLERRAECLKGEPELAAAFSVFYERQKDIPLTLSNGDLLPINVLYDGEKATLIDWEFGGFMPYALDIARFIAHATEDGSVTSFRMSREQKSMFLDLMYEGLEVKPGREIYDRDIRLALLNEYVEILEYYFKNPREERGAVYEMYYPKAVGLAESIIRN